MAKYTIEPDYIDLIMETDGLCCCCCSDDMLDYKEDHDIHVPGIYAWSVAFNRYSDGVESRMLPSFDPVKFHSEGLRLAFEILKQMDPEDELWYYRAFEDDSGMIDRPIRILRLYENFSFSYSQTDYGGSEIQMKFDEVTIDAQPTYMGHNPAWALLSALSYLKGCHVESAREFILQSEPEGHKVELTRCLDYLRVKISYSRNSYGPEESVDNWEVIFDGYVRWDQFVKTVCDGFFRCRREYGIVGYSRRWGMGDAMPMSGHVCLLTLSVN